MHAFTLAGSQIRRICHATNIIITKVNINTHIVSLPSLRHTGPHCFTPAITSFCWVRLKNSKNAADINCCHCCFSLRCLVVGTSRRLLGSYYSSLSLLMSFSQNYIMFEGYYIYIIIITIFHYILLLHIQAALSSLLLLFVTALIGLPLSSLRPIVYCHCLACHTMYYAGVITSVSIGLLLRFTITYCWWIHTAYRRTVI